MARRGGAGAGDARCPTIAAAAPRRALHCASLVVLFSSAAHAISPQMRSAEAWGGIDGFLAASDWAIRPKNRAIYARTKRCEFSGEEKEADAKRTTINPVSLNQSTK